MNENVNLSFSANKNVSIKKIKKLYVHNIREYIYGIV